MSQYNTGTVTVTNGSAVVTGVSTLFSANVTAGDFFTVVGDNAFYTVGAVDSDTQLTLSANYAGVSANAKAYTLVNDFTTNLGFPVPNQGDIETALVVKRAIEEIDAELNTAGIGGDGREWVDLGRRSVSPRTPQGGRSVLPGPQRRQTMLTGAPFHQLGPDCRKTLGEASPRSNRRDPGIEPELQSPPDRPDPQEPESCSAVCR